MKSPLLPPLIPALETQIQKLVQDIGGPILVIGANGFIGWNFFLRLSALGKQTYGLSRQANWRTELSPSPQMYFVSKGDSFESLVTTIQPKLIIDLAAYGAYPEQTDSRKIFATNVERLQNQLEFLTRTFEVRKLPIYLFAGSSSEYGFNCDHSREDESSPNSLYSLSKVQAAQVLSYYSKCHQLKTAHLRIFSVYGPFETPTRLIAQLCLQGVKGQWPRLSDAQNARDFIHVDDVLCAFLATAQSLSQQQELQGTAIYNVGTGTQSTIQDVANLARQVFFLTTSPSFEEKNNRRWDQKTWVANIDKISRELAWRPCFPLAEGFAQTAKWWANFLIEGGNPLPLPGADQPRHRRISVIVALYKDQESILPLYERLVATLEKAKTDFELILVNDRSPDDCEKVITELSQKDPRVIGLHLAGNSGSQRAFWAGLQFAQGDACVLMDGDLQDPPEVIAEFIKVWNQGAKLVLGQRTTREMSPLLNLAHRAFYRMAAQISGANLAADVGDFALMDQQVVQRLLTSRTKTLWLRGLRANLGYRYQLVPYHRPKRPNGSSTNSPIRLLRWAYQGIVLFNGEPLRRWNRLMFFVIIPLDVVLFLWLSPNPVSQLPGYMMFNLILITLVFMSEILVQIYRQVLHHPWGGIERISKGGVIADFEPKTQLTET